MVKITLEQHKELGLTLKLLSDQLAVNYCELYITGTYDNLNIVCEDGEPVFFDTEQEAELYAKENCAFNHKIVGL